MTGAGKKLLKSTKRASQASLLSKHPKSVPEISIPTTKPSKSTPEILISPAPKVSPRPLRRSSDASEINIATTRRQKLSSRLSASKLPQDSPRKASLSKYLGPTQVRTSASSNRPKTASPRKTLASKPSKTTFSSNAPTSKPQESEYAIEKQHREHKISNWQNPFVTYFDRKYPNFRLKHPRPSQQKRIERKILTMLAFFSISIGLWENFRQLWLQENGFSAANVSNIISIGTLVGALGSLMVGKFVKMHKLKRFMTLTLTFRCLVFLALAMLNNSGLRILIDIISIADVTTGMLLLVSVYPLITTIAKSGATFSRRKLVEYLFRDIGILIGGIFIGQQLGNWIIDYNACLLIATAFAAAAAWTMFRVKIRLTEKPPEENFSAVRYIARSHLQRTYMIYTFLAGTAYNVAIGLKMLMLTDSFGFSAGIATNYLLIAGLIADLFGILALKFFTPKSDYLTLIIKFGTRFVLFTLAGLTDNNFVSFIALTWTILSSTAYEDITDGYYINSVDNRYQLKYNTIRYVIHHSGAAFGTFLCGRVFQFGPGAVFTMSGFVIVFQLAAGFYLIYLRQNRPKTTAPVHLSKPVLSKPVKSSKTAAPIKSKASTTVKPTSSLSASVKSTTHR